MNLKVNYMSYAVLIWILSWSSQIEAFTHCSPYSPPEACKIHEVPSRQIYFRVCGDVLKSAFDVVCGGWRRRKRNVVTKVGKIILDKQRADKFLTSHHVTKRSFNAVEECCIEGCVWEELYEYCKP